MLMVTKLHEIINEETAETAEKKCKPWVHTNSGDLRPIKYEIISKGKWDIVAIEK